MGNVEVKPNNEPKPSKGAQWNKAPSQKTTKTLVWDYALDVVYNSNNDGNTVCFFETSALPDIDVSAVTLELTGYSMNQKSTFEIQPFHNDGSSCIGIGGGCAVPMPLNLFPTYTPPTKQPSNPSQPPAPPPPPPPPKPPSQPPPTKPPTKPPKEGPSPWNPVIMQKRIEKNSVVSTAKKRITKDDTFDTVYGPTPHLGALMWNGMQNRTIRCRIKAPKDSLVMLNRIVLTLECTFRETKEVFGNGVTNVPVYKATEGSMKWKASDIKFVKNGKDRINLFQTRLFPRPYQLDLIKVKMEGSITKGVDAFLGSIKDIKTNPEWLSGANETKLFELGSGAKEKTVYGEDFTFPDANNAFYIVLRIQGSMPPKYIEASIKSLEVELFGIIKAPPATGGAGDSNGSGSGNGDSNGSGSGNGDSNGSGTGNGSTTPANPTTRPSSNSSSTSSTSPSTSSTSTPIWKNPKILLPVLGSVVLLILLAKLVLGKKKK